MAIFGGNLVDFATIIKAIFKTTFKVIFKAAFKPIFGINFIAILKNFVTL